MKIEIEKWEGKDGFERYLSYLQEAHRHYELSVTHVLRKNFTSLLSMARPSFLRHVFALHPFESVYRRASMYFRTERLRRVFTFASMYMGMSPFDAPGTYSLLQYTELAEGIWYPTGGFHKVIQGLVDVGNRLGVEYVFNSPISAIQLSADGHTATGVQLENGRKLTADMVVCNADLVYAYNNLLPQSLYAESLATKEQSCSSLSFYWGLDRVVPELKAHNIFLADAYKSSFDSIFKEHSIPDEPSFYVNVPSRVDPSAAPRNCDAVVVLVPIGHLLPGHSNEEDGTPSSETNKQSRELMRKSAREKVLKTIKSRLGVDLEPLIVAEECNDPVTWKSTFNLHQGAILGLSHSFFNVLSFRPKTKHASIKDLYFVGASTHPGTGVPICLAGAKMVSAQILQDIGMSIPWTAGGLQAGNTGKGIDRKDSLQGSLSPLAWLLSITLVLAAFWYGGSNVDIRSMLQRDW